MSESNNTLPCGVTKVVVTNHKTGTGLMQAVLHKYCGKYRLRLLELDQHLRDNKGGIDPAINFQTYDFIFATHAQHFEQLVDAVPTLRYRAVHIIRNPYEIIMSGVRYHQITVEIWCNQKVFVADKEGCCGFRRVRSPEVGNFSYREIMNALSNDDKIEFEIRHQAKPAGTVASIKRFLVRFKDDCNVTSIRLEDIGTTECVSHVFKFLSLNEEFIEYYRRKVGNKKNPGVHITNPGGKETYKSAFNDELYDLFAAEFGTSILRDFGYSRDSTPNYNARDTAARLSAGEAR